MKPSTLFTAAFLLYVILWKNNLHISIYSHALCKKSACKCCYSLLCYICRCQLLLTQLRPGKKNINKYKYSVYHRISLQVSVLKKKKKKSSLFNERVHLSRKLACFSFLKFQTEIRRSEYREQLVNSDCLKDYRVMSLTLNSMTFQLTA